MFTQYNILFKYLFSLRLNHIDPEISKYFNVTQNNFELYKQNDDCDHATLMPFS